MKKRSETIACCLALLALCSLATAERIAIPSGYPDASTTGHSGTLTPSSSITVTEDGTVLEDLDISGGVAVKANDVTIRNCRITGGLYGINASYGYTGLLVEDCTIYDGTSKGIYGGNMIVRRCDISMYSDCMMVQSNVLVEDCYLHDLKITDTSHNDGIQSVGGSHITIRGCTIQAQYQGQTSALIFQTNNGPIDDILFEDNFLSGGTYTLYIKDKGNGYGEPTNDRVRYNMWEKDSWAFGPISVSGDVEFEGNIYHTGELCEFNNVESENSPPVADAGDDQTVTDSDENGSEDVTLDGSGSYDPDGTIDSYVWT
ncbi:MAG: right-handed parallel beta-helix repeat-containing protein, partial [Planctomycetota bacterium]